MSAVSEGSQVRKPEVDRDPPAGGTTKPVAKRSRPGNYGGTARSRHAKARRTHAAIRRLPPTRARRLTPADRPVSPAARRLIDTGAVFDIGADHYVVSEIHGSEAGRQADVLVLRGSDYNHGDVRCLVRALQVRDLERLIEGGLIDFAFGPNARDYNRSRGWGRNGERTMGSLGIKFGSDVR